MMFLKVGEIMTGKHIKEARKARGLTQEQLGEKIGMSGVAIMRYEKGQREPSKEIIEKMAYVLKVSPMDLIGWKLVNDFESFLNYLKSLNYSVFVHQYSEDSYAVEIQKDGFVAEFSQEEFEELQDKCKENVDGAILLQQHKNMNNKKEPSSAATENDSNNN